MQLITDEYKRLNVEKHSTSARYGTVGHMYADEVIKLTDKLKTTDVLDYGCGKSTLAHALPFSIKQYDPCIEKYMADPLPADVVVCTDVMEHIEPECLDNVLRHMHSKTKRILYVSINMVPANKTLADGRNAHLITEDVEFWIPRLAKYFLMISAIRVATDLIVIAEPKELKDE